MSTMSYFDVAMRSFNSIDKQFALAKDINWFNLFAPECEQIIEKLMKAVLEHTSIDKNVFESLEDSHHLTRLARELNRLRSMHIPEEKCAWIKDFYFSSRYPGDDFEEVTEDTAKKLLEETKQLATYLIDEYNSIMRESTTYFND